MDAGFEACVNNLCRYHGLSEVQRNRLLRVFAEVQLSRGAKPLAVYAMVVTLFLEQPQYIQNMDAMTKVLLKMQWPTVPVIAANTIEPAAEPLAS